MTMRMHSLGSVANASLRHSIVMQGRPATHQGSDEYMEGRRNASGMLACSFSYSHPRIALPEKTASRIVGFLDDAMDARARGVEHGVVRLILGRVMQPTL